MRKGLSIIGTMLGDSDDLLSAFWLSGREESKQRANAGSYGADHSGFERNVAYDPAGYSRLSCKKVKNSNEGAFLSTTLRILIRRLFPRRCSIWFSRK